MSLRHSLLLLRSASLAAVALAASAPAGAQISTDQPGLGFSPAVVGAGVFQVEAGTPRAVLDGDEAYSVPVAVRFGVTPAVEVRAATSVLDGFNADGESSVDLGFRSVTVGAKVAVPADAVELALIPEVIVPTEDDGDVVFQVNVPAGFSVGDLGLTLVPGLVTGGGTTQLNAVAVVSRSLGGTLSGYAEAGAFPLVDGDGGTPVYVGAGLAALLNPDTQVDAFFDAGLTDAAPDLVVGVGVSFRID